MLSSVTILICASALVVIIGAFSELRVHFYEKRYMDILRASEDREVNVDKLARASLQMIKEHELILEQNNILRSILTQHFSDEEIKNMIKKIGEDR
ncbi:hypothetical protein NSQ93_21985 [Bacillus sp. FSL W8-0445]|uniref:hypothetical protein n=1 Tax=Bacillota TaxID=1239 RepID=UPI000779D12C|nr:MULTISPECIES: hypothetical protein [Bacillota]MDE1407115.1 hypothetical protein [Bacillus licheniformis]NFT30677.1 hypothetical protein [Clostridium sporogenes]GIN25418.1 hypothetical protein J31TS2_19980 [Bacillus licheniformis]GIN29843.1 hypothetical protein J2TS5_18820 [Bacillus licheniformis]